MWVRAEERAGTFAMAPVAPAAARWGRAIAALVAILVAFAGVAAVGRLFEPQAGTGTTALGQAASPATAVAASAPPSIPSAMIAGGWPPSRSMGDAFTPVRLEQPMAGAEPLTDDAIEVLGKLRIHAASVRVSIQTLDLEVLDSTVVDTSNVDGGIRPLHAPGFDVHLALPTPRPTGELLWIVVTAFNNAGTPVGTVRRVVTIGELAGTD
jgi:hypothetical protein